MADFDFFDSVYNSTKRNIMSAVTSTTSIQTVQMPTLPQVNVTVSSFSSFSSSVSKVTTICQQCKHLNVMTNQYNKVCIDCGIEISDELMKNHIDTNRCNIRKETEKNIYQDVKDMNISDKVIRVANELFTEITSDNIRRGNARRSIVFACVFQSYKILGKPQNPETLISLFHITKSAGMRGMKYLNKHVPKNSKIRTTHITPIDIIKDIIEKFNSSAEQEKSIINIYERIHHKSSMLNRSRPLSIAAGVIFYWIEKNKSNVSLEDFVKKVNMSAITIKKVANEVKRIIDE